jgi:FkbM family methyltransferase
MLHNFAKQIGYRWVAAGLWLPLATLEKMAELQRLKRLLTALRINCFLDVGANRGQTVELLRGIGYRGWIYSFEPVRRVFDELERRLRGDRFWKGYQLALGAASTTVTMQVHPRSTVMSSLLKFRHPPGEVQEETVTVRRLDELGAELIAPLPEPRLFLKMDTQGYDQQVFAGAAGCLGLVLGLQSEVSARAIYQDQPRYLDVMRQYELAGFELSNLSVVSRTPDGAVEDMNCLMHRRTGLA